MTVTAVPGLEPGYVRQRAAALVREGGSHRILLLHAEPNWTGDPATDIDGHTVRIRGCVSHLAVLAEYEQLPDDEYLVVLTDRSTQDLGDAVLLRSWRRRVELPDLWAAVPALFGASECSRDLRRVGTWAANALLAHAPTTGWPRTRGLEVTAEHALGNLLAHLLGRSLPETPDAALVLTTLDDPAARRRWSNVDAALRSELADWAEERLGFDVAFALRVGAHSSPISPLAVGLAMDTIWAGPSGAVSNGLAAGRLIERHLERREVDGAQARVVAESSRAVVRRRLLTEPEAARNALAQAEALLGDLGWAEGAPTSDLLPAGLNARLRDLGAALEKGSSAAEAALARVTEHALAKPDASEINAARMAVRLVRWLETPEADPQTLADSLRGQVRDGGWVDRAVNALWSGAGDGQLAHHYALLLDRVKERRMARDRRAAEQLVAHAAAPYPVDGAVAVEHFLAEVVKPWAGHDGVLLVVLDGMTMAVATEIAEGAGELGLAEWVPADGSRISALAALPSLTELSRASLLSGALVQGAGPAEKRGLARRFPGAPLFHKDNLRAEAGAQLPPEVLAAIDDTQAKPVVAVVINAIDDTLHKQDVGVMEWDLDRLAPLRALMYAASGAGRTIILTADHGHVVERQSEDRPGRAPRWRTPESGELREGELLFTGPRVLVDGGAVLLWREDIHYGRRHPGYHGGAALAEITIPVIVLQRAFTATGAEPPGAPGWIPAAPQTPEWWNEPARAARPEPPVSRPAPRPKTPRTPDPTQDALFDVGEPAPDEAGSSPTDGDLAAAVLASPTYAGQLQRAGRRRPADEVVAAVLRALLERGNRAHRETLAAEAHVPMHVLEPTLAAIKRILNVEGYPVIEDDVDRVTVKLDESLLRDQFGIG